MYSKISVLIPTRKRINRLHTLLHSYRETAKDAGSSELIFRVDADDLDSQDFLLAFKHHVVVGPRLDGYNSLPIFFNEMAAVASGDVLMCGNDDIIFRTLGWAEMILAEANKFPDGLFDIGVKALNEDHFPYCITSRKAIDRMGFFWDPKIFWGDIFLRDVMAAFGRCVLLPSVEIEHDWAGYKPDGVFAESDKDIVSRDPTYWSVTHMTAVSAAVEKLRGMVA